jgi:hypothetical protein
LSCSLYRQFPARTPMANTTEYFEIKSHVNSIEPGLGRTGSQQAGYQIVALLVSLALALVGGLITGKLPSYNPAFCWKFQEILNSMIERCRFDFAPAGVRTRPT